MVTPAVHPDSLESETSIKIDSNLAYGILEFVMVRSSSGTQWN